jgi:hypothetical protein
MIRAEIGRKNRQIINKIKWDMCLCILNIILKYAVVPALGNTENWH